MEKHLESKLYDNPNTGMTRRSFLKGLAAAGVALFTGFMTGCGDDCTSPWDHPTGKCNITEIVREKRPLLSETLDIVHIVLDCWRYDFYNHNSTPGLLDIGKKGVQFSHYYANSGYTRPSSVSYFSGQLPQFEKENDSLRALGFRNSEIGAGGFELIPSTLITFPQLLKNFGYLTMAVVDNPALTSLTGYGLNQWDILEDFAVLEREKRKRFGAEHLVKKTLKNIFQLRKKSSNPFYIYLHFNDAHFPYDKLHLTHKEEATQRKFLCTRDEKFDSVLRRSVLLEVKERYRSAVRYLDEQVSTFVRRVQAIQESRQRDTLFIITADHGEMFNETGEVWNIHHGVHMPEEILHVPLVLYGGNLKPKIVPGLCEAIDLAPTILEVVGIPPTREMKGISLLRDPNKKEVCAYSPYETSCIYKKETGVFERSRKEL